LFLESGVGSEHSVDTNGFSWRYRLLRRRNSPERVFRVTIAHMEKNGFIDSGIDPSESESPGGRNCGRYFSFPALPDLLIVASDQDVVTDDLAVSCETCRT